MKQARALPRGASAPRGIFPSETLCWRRRSHLRMTSRSPSQWRIADLSTRGRRASHDARAIQGARFRGAELPYVQVASADKTRLCRNHVGWLGIAVVASLAGPARSDGTKRVKPVRPGLPNPLRLAAPDASGRQPCGPELKCSFLTMLAALRSPAESWPELQIRITQLVREGSRCGA